MEGFIHNLNTMHSRAGAQVPFTSINFGTDTSKSGRLVSKYLLEATMKGLGKGETPIFPISIFKVKEGVNYNPEDPNYDLFKRSMEVSAKRLFPNFCFIDAPFNLQYYKKGDYRTEIATMGCRTRTFGSIFPESDGIVTGRGNCSFTTINLVRIGIKHGICIGKFQRDFLPEMPAAHMGKHKLQIRYLFAYMQAHVRGAVHNPGKADVIPGMGDGKQTELRAPFQYVHGSDIIQINPLVDRMQLDAFETELSDSCELFIPVFISRMHRPDRYDALVFEFQIVFISDGIDLFHLMRLCGNRQNDRIINARLCHRSVKTRVCGIALRLHMGRMGK
jgi:hypothetical protein